MHKLVVHWLTSQEEAEDANTGGMFWHPIYVTFLKEHNQPWGEMGLMGCNLSLFHCTRYYSRKIPVDLILACTNVLCSVFSLQFKWPKGWGLTICPTVGSPSPQAFFLHPTFPLLFHTLFPAEDPLIELSQAPYRQCHFFLFIFFTLSMGIFAGWKNRRSDFCSTSLPASVYAGSFLQNVPNLNEKAPIII